MLAVHNLVLKFAARTFQNMPGLLVIIRLKQTKQLNFAKLSSVKVSTSQIELTLALLSLYSQPIWASIFEPLLDYPGC